MSTTDDLNAGMKSARHRVGRMRHAVEDLNQKIKALERRQRDADARDKSLIALELRTAGEQRLSAFELLAEAESQLSDQEQRFREAVSVAKRELAKTTQVCMDAARRFDRAMSEAFAALEDVETAADQIRPFLANGIGSYTGTRDITAAFRHAFKDRLGADQRSGRSMTDRIGRMVGDARQNAADVETRRAA